MGSERALKMVLVLVGALFILTAFPLLIFLWQNQPEYSLQMMLSVYVILGIYLILAARHPMAHRSLIGFTAWSSFAHGAVMVVQALHSPASRFHLLTGTIVLSIIGIALLVLSKTTAEKTSAVPA